jgi:hypothetical protein
MRTTPIRLGLAGTAVACTAALLPTSAAIAATPAQNENPTAQKTVAAAAFTVRAGIATNPARNLIAASGTIRDTTSGRDVVAVQTFIQRLDGRRWVTVVTGVRRVGVNTATSSIGTRSCTNGKTYRTKVNYNWNNIRRGSVYSPSRGC